MRRLVLFSLLVLGVFAAPQTEKKVPRKVPGSAKLECAQGSICFSGEAGEGQDFRKSINSELDFVLNAPGDFGVILKHASGSCSNLFWIANPPFHAHRETEIDAQYDWTAEQEVQTSPREFRFATSCAEYQTLNDLLQTDDEKFVLRLESLPKGRLWITDSRVTHSHGSVSKEQGAIEWIKFSVEIKLPNPN